MATQGARIDNLFQKFMEQSTDYQKQFAIQSKEIAEASKKADERYIETAKEADERYYELLNAIKKTSENNHFKYLNSRKSQRSIWFITYNEE